MMSSLLLDPVVNARFFRDLVLQMIASCTSFVAASISFLFSLVFVCLG